MTILSRLAGIQAKLEEINQEYSDIQGDVIFLNIEGVDQQSLAICAAFAISAKDWLDQTITAIEDFEESEEDKWRPREPNPYKLDYDRILTDEELSEEIPPDPDPDFEFKLDMWSSYAQDCPQCYGTGTVDNHTRDCPYCDGQGVVFDE
jgi:hypothetical protein